jgi:hypothetical protein
MLAVTSCSAKQTTLKAGRRPSIGRALRSLGSLILLGAVFVGLVLFFGHQIYTTSVDLGWHYSLAEFIFEHASLPANGVIGLGPMLE